MTRNTALRWLALLISLSAISIWSIASADLDRDWKVFAFVLAVVACWSLRWRGSSSPLNGLNVWAVAIPAAGSCEQLDR